MKTNQIFALILSGGQSSRLFPFNKVVSDLAGTGQSLLQESFKRGLGLTARDHIYALTVSSMAPLLRRQLKLPTARVFSDPARRGTWPAILWAMSHLRGKDPQAVVAVLTGDHVIPTNKAFQRSARAAMRLASEQAAVIMLGVRPSKEAEGWRGFGCFRVNAEGCVTEFEEKPSLEHAQQMIDAGGWWWNSGMFFFRISTVEEALRRFQPAMHAIYGRLCEKVKRKDSAGAEAVFAEFPEKIPHPRDPSRLVDNTIDFAIMAPLVEGHFADLTAGGIPDALPRWFDIGQWPALRQIHRPDRRGNVALGRVKLAKDVHQCIVAADRGCRIEVEGLQDAVVALSGKTALILPLAYLEWIKPLGQEAQTHPDRLIIERETTDCRIDAPQGRVVIGGLNGFRVRLKGRQLQIQPA